MCSDGDFGTGRGVGGVAETLGGIHSGVCETRALRAVQWSFCFSIRELESQNSWASTITMTTLPPMNGTCIRMECQCRPRSSGTFGRRRPSLLGSRSGTLTGSSANWGTLTKRIGRRSALAVPGTAHLYPQHLAPNAELFALPHIDIHGDIWFSELTMHLMRRMHILRPPPSGQCKDLDDWCREGGANRDSLHG